MHRLHMASIFVTHAIFRPTPTVTFCLDTSDNVTTTSRANSQAPKPSRRLRKRRANHPWRNLGKSRRPMPPMGMIPSTRRAVTTMASLANVVKIRPRRHLLAHSWHSRDPMGLPPNQARLRPFCPKTATALATLRQQAWPSPRPRLSTTVSNTNSTNNSSHLHSSSNRISIKEVTAAAPARQRTLPTTPTTPAPADSCLPSTMP